MSMGHNPFWKAPLNSVTVEAETSCSQVVALLLTEVKELLPPSCGIYKAGVLFLFFITKLCTFLFKKMLLDISLIFSSKVRRLALIPGNFLLRASGLRCKIHIMEAIAGFEGKISSSRHSTLLPENDGGLSNQPSPSSGRELMKGVFRQVRLTWGKGLRPASVFECTVVKMLPCGFQKPRWDCALSSLCGCQRDTGTQGPPDREVL